MLVLCWSLIFGVSASSNLISSGWRGKRKSITLYASLHIFLAISLALCLEKNSIKVFYEIYDLEACADFVTEKAIGHDI